MGCGVAVKTLSCRVDSGGPEQLDPRFLMHAGGRGWGWKAPPCRAVAQARSTHARARTLGGPPGRPESRRPLGPPAVVAISPNCINDNDQNHKKSGLLTTDPRHPWPNTGEKRVRCGASHSEPVETKCFEPTDQHARAPSVNWFPL